MSLRGSTHLIVYLGITMYHSTGSSIERFLKEHATSVSRRKEKWLARTHNMSVTKDPLLGGERHHTTTRERGLRLKATTTAKSSEESTAPDQ